MVPFASARTITVHFDKLTVGNIISNNADNIDTVSYTHLDVYKRPSWSKVGNDLPLFISNTIPGSNDIIGAGAVSYTHLYLRTQTRGRTGMEVNPLVFETSASTDSAIWACLISQLRCKDTAFFRCV